MGVVAQAVSGIVEEVRHCEMEVLWMEVRILGIYHPDHQDNPVLHYRDYRESHLVMSFQKKGLEALCHHQGFPEECDLPDPEFHLDMMNPIIFGTFNEFGVRNRSIFSPQNCLHDAKVSLPAPSIERLQEVEKLPNYDAYVHIISVSSIAEWYALL